MRVGRSLVLVGEVFITLGVLLAGYVFYQLVWTGRTAEALQNTANEQLDEIWQAPENTRATSLAADDSGPIPFARIRIPEFGSDFNYAIVSGVTDADLAAGPGHYPSSQGPGEPGNFALAGHRVGRGSPFNDLGRLEACDAIVIETTDAWLDYRVLPIDAPDTGAAQREAADCMPQNITARLGADYAGITGRSIVSPDRTDVLEPIPSRAATPAPDQLPLLTLTTCHPQFSAAERLIVHAILVEKTPKSDAGLPPALGGQ